MSTEPIKDDIEIEDVQAFEFEFEGFTICYESGMWWADFLGDEDEPIFILEAPENDIYFDEDEALLEVGITQEIFDKLKKVVYEANS